MVLLVLALAWGAVLFFWFRSRSQSSFSDSVGLFHRHLHVLERAAPGTRLPANRLRAPGTVVPFGALRPVGGASPQRHMPRAASYPRSSGAQVVATARRRQSQRRRRDVLFLLGIITAATFIIAAVTRGTDAIAAQLLSDAVLGGYVALLVRLRNMSAERELQPRSRAGAMVRQPVGAGRPARRTPARRAPALSSGYAMASGYGAASGFGAAANGRTDRRYGMAGYGDVAMRRAVGH